MIKRKQKIDPAELKAEQFLHRVWFIIRREWKKGINWLFFYKPKDKKMGYIHIFDVLVLIYLTVRLINQ